MDEFIKFGKDMAEKRRRHIACESDKPRERNVCPICSSLNVKKRRRRPTYDYECHRCGWTGQSIKKIMY